MSKDIIISDARYEETAVEGKISCSIYGDGLPRELWCSTELSNSLRLSRNSLNWAIVALLYPAMFLGRNIFVSGPASKSLIDCLNNDLQSFLLAFNPSLKRIVIDVREESKEISDQSKLNATGFSAGIDSFSTLARYFYSETSSPDEKVSALSVFNVGAFGDSAEASTRLYENAKNRLINFSEGKKLIALDLNSNIGDCYLLGGALECGFQKTNTLRNVAAALAFEGAIGTYYISSTFSPDCISTRPSYNIAYLDPIILPLFSFGVTRFVSSCCGMSRFEKTMQVAALEDAWRYLDVCTQGEVERMRINMKNCGECLKCCRTLFALEKIGKLEPFAARFELDKFYRNRNSLVGKLRKSAARGNTLDAEVISNLGIVTQSGLSKFLAWGFARRFRSRLRRGKSD